MIKIEKLGATENKSKRIEHARATEERKIFNCQICKNRCRLETTTHTEGVAPEWCPFENDFTNIRYSKWSEDDEQ